MRPVPNPPRPGPHRYAWGPKPWYFITRTGSYSLRRYRTKREATEAYRAWRNGAKIRMRQR